MLQDIILWLAGIGVVLGGFDYLIGSRFGLGEKFREGFRIMPSLALSMTGIIIMAPVMAACLRPVLVPVFRLFGADPAMFAAIIANDMGGYPLAMDLAEDPQMGMLSGCVIASMLGCTLTFTIPVGFGMIEREHQDDMVHGLLIGLPAIPIGGIAAGLVAGFAPIAVLVNLIPIAVVSLLLAAGFKFVPKFVEKLVLTFCAVMRTVGLFGIIIGCFTKLTGVAIPLLGNADTIGNAMAVVAEIVIVLVGILPILELLMRVAKKPICALSRLLKINDTAACGLIYTLANGVPTFTSFQNMDARGRILNAAWLVTASAMLGDHIGYTVATAPELLTPMLIGRAAASACALLLAVLQTRKLKEE